MKKIILSMAIAAIFASCSNNKPADQATTTPAVNSADTIGLSDYKEWKQKQELQGPQQTFTSPGVNDPGSVTEIAPPAEAKPQPKTVIIYRDAPARQPRVAKASRPSSHSVYKTPEAEPETPSVAKAPAPVSSGSKREPYGRGTTGTEGTAGSGTTPSNEGEGNGNGDVAVGTGTTPTPAQVPAKKDGGWSKAAKGGAIGGASGAVIGAIFSKNKTKGAVIGGIVGAAGGYIFGRSKDKKDTTKN